MKIDTAVFRTTAVDLEDCPKSKLPEFAFVGRSNVGKSSLINMLTGKKGLAKTSSTPGKTQLINFFEINTSWSLVDLPGYGYAKVSKKKKKEFNISVSGYLNGRENLKKIFVLVDSQHDPMEGDLAFVQWLAQCQLPFSIIFTKADRASNHRAKENRELFVANLEAWEIPVPPVFSCSSKTGLGRNDILQFIEKQLPRLKKKGGKSPKSSISLDWMKR